MKLVERNQSVCWNNRRLYSFWLKTWLPFRGSAIDVHGLPAQPRCYAVNHPHTRPVCPMICATLFLGLSPTPEKQPG